MLKLKTQVEDNILIVQVIEQDEKDRCRRRGSNKYLHTANGFCFISASFPYVNIGTKEIFLRGAKLERDYDFWSGKFDTHVEAIDFKKELLKAVEEFNSRGGFQTEESTKTFHFCVNCSGRYESSIEVPVSYTENQAREYAQRHLDKATKHNVELSFDTVDSTLGYFEE